MVKCANCGKLINVENAFGIFVILEKDKKIDLGGIRPLYFKEEHGMVQVKICDDCLKRKHILINPYRVLKEYEKEKN